MSDKTLKPSQLIHGENFYIAESSLHLLVGKELARNMKTKLQRECQHQFGPWVSYDRGEYRDCHKCGHSELQR